MIIVTTSFSKSAVIKTISVHTKNENGLKGVLETLRFRDGLVRTAGLAVEVITRERAKGERTDFFYVSVTSSLRYID